MDKTLFKQDSKGNIRIWQISVNGDSYTVSHGVQNGKLQHKTTLAKPKNIGRSNETTAQQQAELEANALYKKQIERECYVTDLSHPPAYLQPQLCLDASEVPHRINWDNASSTPKMDGVRAIWTPNGLQSRKGTFYSVPHLEDALHKINIPLDGEIYLHGMPLNRINGAVRKHSELTGKLEFWVFDAAVSNMTFEERFKMLETLKLPNAIKLVSPEKLLETEMQQRHDLYVKQGFEGLIIRDNKACYGFGERNPSLMKYKAFQDAEFLIVGVHADKHDDQGMLDLVTAEGQFFSARARGDNDYRRFMLNHPELFIGKYATVRYFSITEYGVPQFPVVTVIDDIK